MALTVLVVLPSWIAVTLLTRPVAAEHLRAFYVRVRPGGVGWIKIAGDIPGFERDGPDRKTLFRIISGVVSLVAALFCIGDFVLGNPVRGIMYGLIALTGGIVLALLMRDEVEKHV